MLHEQDCVKSVHEKAGKDSIASVLEERAERIASLSVDIFQRANSRLQCISRLSSPECNKETSSLESYPPLFESLRSSLLSIERSLNGINDCLDRLEV